MSDRNFQDLDDSFLEDVKPPEEILLYELKVLLTRLFALYQQPYILLREEAGSVWCWELRWDGFYGPVEVPRCYYIPKEAKEMILVRLNEHNLTLNDIKSNDVESMNILRGLKWDVSNQPAIAVGILSPHDIAIVIDMLKNGCSAGENYFSFKPDGSAENLESYYFGTLGEKCYITLWRRLSIQSQEEWIKRISPLIPEISYKDVYPAFELGVIIPEDFIDVTGYYSPCTSEMLTFVDNRTQIALLIDINNDSASKYMLYHSPFNMEEEFEEFLFESDDFNDILARLEKYKSGRSFVMLDALLERFNNEVLHALKLNNLSDLEFRRIMDRIRCLFETISLSFNEQEGSIWRHYLFWAVKNDIENRRRLEVDEAKTMLKWSSEILEIVARTPKYSAMEEYHKDLLEWINESPEKSPGE